MKEKKYGIVWARVLHTKGEFGYFGAVLVDNEKDQRLKNYVVTVERLGLETRTQILTAEEFDEFMRNGRAYTAM